MPVEPDAHALHALMDRRLVFVMGKGGVGKSSTAISLAFAAESAGKRVLLAETDESRTIGEFFDVPQLTETPVHVSENIRIARIDPKAELEAYTQFHVKSGFVAQRITKSRLFDHMSEATPGLKEIMTLGRIWRWEIARTPHTDGPLYDLIIIDSPATGHALSLFRLPKLLMDMIRMGPLVSQLQDLLKLLKDENRTWLTLVSTPEELPVKESMELMTTAENEIGIPVRLMFLNGVYPELFTSRQTEIFEKKISDILEDTFSDADGGLGAIIAGARHQYRRRRIHEGYIDQLNSELSIPLIEIPYFFVNHLSISEIRQIASGWLLPQRSETGSNPSQQDSTNVG